MTRKSDHTGCAFLTQKTDGLTEGACGVDDVIDDDRGMPNVMNFLGGKDHKPEPLRNSEVQKLFGKVDELSDSGEVNVEPFILNESVKIIDGPFNDFVGTIDEIHEEKKKIKVIVKIFGRRTPVEVNFLQVEKVS